MSLDLRFWSSSNGFPAIEVESIGADPNRKTFAVQFKRVHDLGDRRLGHPG
jgi:hypothetical protein